MNFVCVGTRTIRVRFIKNYFMASGSHIHYVGVAAEICSCFSCKGEFNLLSSSLVASQAIEAPSDSWTILQIVYTLFLVGVLPMVSMPSRFYRFCSLEMLFRSNLIGNSSRCASALGNLVLSLELIIYNTQDNLQI